MPDTNTNITNIELIKQLQNSYIDANQKKELEAVIPQMTDDEKQELVGLIEQSKEEYKKGESQYNNQLDELNKEYTEKMNHLVKESTEKAFKDAEASDQNETSEKIKTVEGEISSIQTQKKQAPNEVKKEVQKKSHVVRNLIFILLFLIILAGGALYALNKVSALNL
ncbi:hypothetical protein KAR91_00975 [Candidatus Pacearchaeota archaeon]|nr:hypothetical protein [Candidatus Pacearchaeota archaeon]